jgi:hypothetical protein
MKSISRGVRMKADVWLALQLEARKNGRSVSDEIEEIVTQHLRRMQEDRGHDR